MRTRTIVLIAVTAVAAGVVWLGVTLTSRGFSAREEPSWWEELLARSARKIATPAGAKQLQNPYPLTDEKLVTAREHWVDHCAICHGLDGSGKTDLGRNLYPPAPDMRDTVTQDLSDGELFYIINNGVRLTGMPAWGGLHSPKETWELVSFIRRLPNLSEAEIKLMEELSTGGAAQTGGAGHQHGPGTKPRTD